MSPPPGVGSGRCVAPARREDPEARAPRSRGRAQRRVGVRPRHRAVSPAPRLPDRRRAEGRNDRALRVPPLAPARSRARRGRRSASSTATTRAASAGTGATSRSSAPATRASATVVGEASPSYVFHPLAPERVAALVPDVAPRRAAPRPGRPRLLHYQHEVALGRESLSFEDALDAERPGWPASASGCSPTRGTSVTPGGITRTSRAGSTPSSSSAGSPFSRASSCSC